MIIERANIPDITEAEYLPPELFGEPVANQPAADVIHIAKAIVEPDIIESILFKATTLHIEVYKEVENKQYHLTTSMPDRPDDRIAWYEGLDNDKIERILVKAGVEIDV